MARYQIHHRTCYAYDYPVSVSHHSACLKPRMHRRQNCLQYDLAIKPSPSDLITRTDFFGNTLHLFSIEDSHGELVVDAHSEVSVEPVQIPIEALSPTCDDVRENVHMDLTREGIQTIQFISPSPCVEITESVREFVEPHFDGRANFLTCASDIARRINDEFTFDPSATDVTTHIDQVIDQKSGVCQDFAHLMIACLRAMELPARYVSGYILTHPPEGQPRLVGADASHAWVSVFVPTFGWVDIDPTNRQLCNEEHVMVAYGRDFSDVSMLKGAVTGGGPHRIRIEVTMTPLSTAPTQRLML